MCSSEGIGAGVYRCCECKGVNACTIMHVNIRVCMSVMVGVGVCVNLSVC